MTVERPPANARFPLLDGLRGVAATWVVLAHFYGAHSLSAGLGVYTPAPVDWLLYHPTLGVVIFFCLSGYVIAHSLAGGRFTPGRAGNFVARRSLRLDPPYFVTIVLVAVLNAASNLVLRDRQLPTPSAGYLLAHLVYLQELLYGGSLLGVFWTLCLEVQLYLTFALTLLVAHACIKPQASSEELRRSAVLAYLPVAAVACYWPLTLSPEMPRSGWLFMYWHLFVLGVFARWSEDDRLARWVLVALVAVESVVVARGFLAEAADVGGSTVAHTQSAAALAVVGVIVLGRATGGIHRWLGSAGFQYLGRISYSLYLTHDLSGRRLLNLSTRFGPHTPLADSLRLVVALGVSLAFAHLMYVGVERPFVALSRRFRRPAARPDPGAAVPSAA